MTERELEVWRYLSTPLSAREIADALFISRNTLKSHLRSIFRKLAVHSRPGAVNKGIALGLVEALPGQLAILPLVVPGGWLDTLLAFTG